MKFIVNHEKIRTIEYHESFWTRKKEIIINGTSFKKIDKQDFMYNPDSDDKVTKLNGNFFLEQASSLADKLFK